MYYRDVDQNFKSFASALLAVLLLAASVSTQNTASRGQSFRPHSQTSVDCNEPWVLQDVRGRVRRALDDVRRCRESLRRRNAAKPAANGQRTGRVTLTEIGPVGGSSFSRAGFIFNGEDTRQIILPGLRLFRSLNGGHDWSPISVLGVAAAPYVVRQDPHNPQVLLAVITDGLVRSEDFGTTWTPLEASSFFYAVDFAFNQASSNVILFLDSFGTILRSNDGGTTVEYQPDTGLPTVQLDPETGDFIAYPEYSNIATTPADPNIVYVVLHNDPVGYYAPGIFKSIDGGQTFARLEGSWSHPLQVFPHPTNPSVLYVQEYVKDSFPSDVFGALRIYRSIDAGVSFNPVTTGAPEDQFDHFVAFDGHNPSFVYIAGRAGFFRSTDDGNSFHRLGLTAEQVGLEATTASVDPTNPNMLYVNTSRGNFKSANGGKTFQSISNGWRSVGISHLAFDHTSEPSLYVAALEGLGMLRTRTRGKNYEQIPPPIDPNDLLAGVPILGISPTNPDIILAGTFAKGLFRTTNGGKSWAKSTVDTGHGEFNNFSTQIAIDPINPNNVYFAVSMGTFSLGFPGFYRSTDGGSTFQRTTSQPLDRLGIDNINPGVVYAGLRVGVLNFAPLKSVDGGLNFSSGPIFQAFGMRRIVIDPINSNNVYLIFRFSGSFGDRRMVRSTDGGVTYSAADEGLFDTFVIDLVIDPQDPRRLYAWTDEGLFISTDRATSWTLLEGAEAFKAAGSVSRLTINPKKPNLLYLSGPSVVEVEIK